MICLFKVAADKKQYHVPGSGPPYGEKLLQLLYAFNNTLNSLPEDKTKKVKKGAQGAGGHSLLGDGGNKLPVSITTNKSLAGDVHVKVAFFVVSNALYLKIELHVPYSPVFKVKNLLRIGAPLPVSFSAACTYLYVTQKNKISENR